MAAYADYTYYTNGYLQGMNGIVPEEAFPFCASQASRLIDRYTFNRLKGKTDSEIPDAVRFCTCSLSEFVYGIRQYKENISNNGGERVVSYSNDGVSATLDTNTVYNNQTEIDGQIRAIILTTLADTGLCYAGCDPLNSDPYDLNIRGNDEN